MVDRLLPFNFSVEHIPGINMGFANYFSRHPQSKAITPSKEDENFVINLIGTFKLLPKKADKNSSNRNAIYKPALADITTAEKAKENRGKSREK